MSTGYVVNGTELTSGGGGGGGGVVITTGHTYDRPTPVAAGSGNVFVDEDAPQAYLSTGSEWLVQLASGLGRDKAGIAPHGGTMLLSAAGLTGLVIGACTAAVLFTMDASLPTVVYTLLATGDGSGATRGLQLYLRNDTGTLTIASAKNGSLVTLVNAPAAGLHCFAVTLVDHGTHHAAWRWSLDGAVVDQLDMTSDYAAPETSDPLGIGSRSDGYGLDGGEICDVAIWESTLTDPQLRSVSTLPGTPTYSLPITGAMGSPIYRVEGRRYDPNLPTVVPAQNLPPLTASAGVRKVNH